MTSSRLARGLASSPPLHDFRPQSLLGPFPLSATSFDGRLHSLRLALTDCWNYRYFKFAVLVTRADRPIPTCLARIGHPILSRSPAFIPQHRFGFPISHIFSFIYCGRAQERHQHGHCHIQTNLPYPENEATAPAFLSTWG